MNLSYFSIKTCWVLGGKKKLENHSCTTIWIELYPRWLVEWFDIKVVPGENMCILYSTPIWYVCVCKLSLRKKKWNCKNSLPLNISSFSIKECWILKQKKIAPPYDTKFINHHRSWIIMSFSFSPQICYVHHCYLELVWPTIPFNSKILK